MKRTGFHHRRKPIPLRSPRRQAEVEERRDLVARVLARDAWRCRAPARFAAAGVDDPVECGGPLDAHEIIPRSAWPGGHLVEANILSVCRSHHGFIDENPTAAHEVGLHGYSWERPR